MFGIVMSKQRRGSGGTDVPAQGRRCHRGAVAQESLDESELGIWVFYADSRCDAPASTAWRRQIL